MSRYWMSFGSLGPGSDLLVSGLWASEPVEYPQAQLQLVAFAVPVQSEFLPPGQQKDCMDRCLLPWSLKSYQEPIGVKLILRSL